KLNAMYGKYTALISGGTFYPDWMKEKEAAETRSFAAISYVSVPYSTINDSAVTVSDNDIKSYLEKNKLKYEQEGGRIISYVSFSAEPSAADTLRSLESVSALQEQFRADSNAKNFVAR